MQSGLEDRPRWWQWPTILSLDAPAVAVLWQRLLADAVSVRLSAAESLVLGASVWLCYTADRWFEAGRLPKEAVRTHRHRFHQVRRTAIASVWVLVLALDLALAFGRLGPGDLQAGAVLLVPVLAYVLSHQGIHRTSRWRAPKELCVALLLSAGACIFVGTHPGARLEGLVIPTALFAALCFSNCALISAWEHEVDRSQGQDSLALQFRGMAVVAGALPWGVAIACAAAWLLSPPTRTVALCGAVSAVFLGLVNIFERRLGRIGARVLADVALMTPAVALIARRA